MAARWLAIGLNKVDPAGYAGWEGPLAACENDARDMAALAAAQGFGEAAVLLTAQATSEAVLRYLQEAADALRSGDHLVVSFSGHGGQVQDVDADEAGDQLDETWCVFDRMLLDDELHAAWARFRAGVRILLVSDCCHSGTIARLPVRARRLAPERAQAIHDHHRATYAAAREAAAAAPADVAASVIVYSACQDDQLALDGPQNGAFTAALKAQWDGGAFQGTHAEFLGGIAHRLAGTQQTPNYSELGADDPAFRAARPFTL